MAILLTLLCVSNPTIDGVSHAGKRFELVKRLTAHRSVIYGERAPGPNSAHQQQDEVRMGLENLAVGLDAALAAVSESYPLLNGVVLDYTYLRPMEQSEARGRMYIMYIGELRWPFPAPLFADLLRIRVPYLFSQPIRDLLTTVLMRWGRDHIDRPNNESSLARKERIDGWIGTLESSPLMWGRDRVVRDLSTERLLPDEVARLRELAITGKLPARMAALEVLGTGGYVTDVGFYRPLLEDAALEVRERAFWALVSMPGKKGPATAQTYSGRADAIARRLKQTRAKVSHQMAVIEVAHFDALTRAISGAAPVPSELTIIPPDPPQEEEEPKPDTFSETP